MCVEHALAQLTAVITIASSQKGANLIVPGDAVVTRVQLAIFREECSGCLPAACAQILCIGMLNALDGTQALRMAESGLSLRQCFLRRYVGGQNTEGQQSEEQQQTS